MVHACVVCKKVDHLDPELSFHRFPQDHEKRKLWFSLVGILENQPLRKNPELCSDHFYPEDVLVRTNGAKYIRKDANPRRCEGFLFLEDSSSGSDSTDSIFFGAPPDAEKKPLQIKLCPDTDDDEFDEIVDRSSNIEKPDTSILNFVSVPGLPGNIRINSPQIDNVPSPSTTETASEAEIQPVVKMETSNSRKRRSYYIGDMTSSDFSTPEKRKKNVKIIKSTIAKQRKTIYNLRKQVKRFQRRVKTLTEIIKMLRR